MNLKQQLTLKRLHTNTLNRIGEDLRKGASLAGIGIVGIIIFSDNISIGEGLILFLLGTIMWIIGLVFSYYHDLRNQKED